MTLGHGRNRDQTQADTPGTRSSDPVRGPRDHIKIELSGKLRLANDHLGEKAVIRKATSKLVGIVRNSVEQGRERMIFASDTHHDRLPQTKKFNRRTQARLRCSKRTPQAEYIEPPGCCVNLSNAFAASPDVALCNNGLHVPALDMWSYK
jgi:hypothetical protein